MSHLPSSSRKRRRDEDEGRDEIKSIKIEEGSGESSRMVEDKVYEGVMEDDIAKSKEKEASMSLRFNALEAASGLLSTVIHAHTILKTIPHHLEKSIEKITSRIEVQYTDARLKKALIEPCQTFSGVLNEVSREEALAKQVATERLENLFSEAAELTCDWLIGPEDVNMKERMERELEEIRAAKKKLERMQKDATEMESVLDREGLDELVDGWKDEAGRIAATCQDLFDTAFVHKDDVEKALRRKVLSGEKVTSFKATLEMALAEDRDHDKFMGEMDKILRSLEVLRPERLSKLVESSETLKGWTNKHILDMCKEFLKSEKSEVIGQQFELRKPQYIAQILERIRREYQRRGVIL